MSTVPDYLQARAEQLCKDDPLTQSIRWIPANWQKRLSEDADLEKLATTYPTVITRRDLQLIGQAASSRQLWLATMIWGYGTVGYGAFRTSAMLSTPHFEETLNKSIDLLKAGEIINAWNLFTNPQTKLARCGSAFFTKFFYSVGLSQNLHPLPLVLDSVVYGALRQHLNWEGTIYYSAYVRQLNSWAETLQCRPDAIERLLFDSGKKG